MSHKCPLWRISGAFITVICNILEICQIPSVSSGGVFGEVMTGFHEPFEPFMSHLFPPRSVSHLRDSVPFVQFMSTLHG